jgi:Mg2+/Co2+ transporter CorB
LINISPGVLCAVLIFLIVLAAFFSAAEIGLMTLNRYRLRHLAESGHRGAQLARKLLERPDRLLGLILLGNNFTTIAASSVATLLALELYGEAAIGIAAILLTLVVLIFAEVAPKTLAAMHPEKIAFPVAYILRPLLKLLYPLVWLVNAIANRFLRLLGVSVQAKPSDKVSAEELRTIVMEAGAFIPKAHRDMLLAILDLENITVDDVMVPRGEIEGIDLDAEWEDILHRLASSHYTRLPVYRGTLDNVVGIVHLRKVLPLMYGGNFNRDTFMQAIIEPYFIPQGTPLHTQLLNFKTVKRHIGLVVNEYGDLMGLVSLEEILEEIVGDFTTQPPGTMDDIHPQEDGSFLVNGSANIRDLNRTLGWELPTDGPKTLNGLIVEYLEDIPEVGTSLLLNGYLVEIVRTRGTAVQLARIHPKRPDSHAAAAS